MAADSENNVTRLVVGCAIGESILECASLKHDVSRSVLPNVELVKEN